MKGVELIKDVMPSLDGGVAKHLATRDDLERDATEAHADLDAGMAGVFALGGPARRQRLEVVIAHDEIVGDAEDGGAQGTVAGADQRAVGVIDLIALVA